MGELSADESSAGELSVGESSGHDKMHGTDDGSFDFNILITYSVIVVRKMNV